MTKVLCRADELAVDSGKEILLEGPDGHTWIALFRIGGEIRAYLNTCPHMGRSLSYAPDEFLLEEDGTLVCPHHGACFDLSTGICVSGPCVNARLTPVPIAISGGEVKCLKKSG